jgi:hypothetical protein
MRLLFLTSIALLSGCATLPADPNLVSVAVEPTTVVCGESDREIPVVLEVKNNSSGVLNLWIEPRLKQPPYYLSWLNYEVLSGTTESDEVDWKHGPGGHGPLPVHTLHIGKGDSTRLVAPLYEIKSEDYVKSFRIRFNDTAKNNYVSASFKPCIVR